MVANHVNWMNVLRILHLLPLFLSLLTCSDEAPHDSIPFAPVNFQIDLKVLDHSLQNPLTYKIFTEQDRRYEEDRFGFSGVMVVSNATATELYAYDLCCPYEKRREIRIVPDEYGTATCENCGSSFATLYGLGTVQHGPATQSLQRYNVFPIPSRPGSFRVANDFFSH